MLGAIIASVHGGTLQDAVRHYVTGPLAMHDTAFEARDPDRLAVPYADGRRRACAAWPTRMW